MGVSRGAHSIIAAAMPMAGSVVAAKTQNFLIPHINAYGWTADALNPGPQDSQRPHVGRYLAVRRQRNV